MNLVEKMKIVEALQPATDAAGRAGDYVSLKNCHMAFVVFHITQGNAATVALSINQATAVAPAGAVPITLPVKIWANQDCAAGDTLVRQTDAVNFTTSAALAHKIVVFQIDPATLNLAGGFDCIAAVTGASNVDNITSAVYYLTEDRYKQATPPSAILD
jgi:hypothetical protein